MIASRFLVVIADDYGIGPETSRGIRDLARRSVVTGSVLLVNAPHAADAVRAWRRGTPGLDLGWHPCLTLDEPVAGAARVPTLVGADGRFLSLGRFLTRLYRGLVRPDDIERELHAQYHRFVELVGRPPTLVNTHQHVALFPPVGAILIDLLRGCRPRPYLRRVREPWSVLARIGEARLKRLVLSSLGRLHGRTQDRAGFPGNDWLAGAAGSRPLGDPSFFGRWLSRMPGRVVELMCHPGHHDPTLIGRDSGNDPGPLERRVEEWNLLAHPDFREAVRSSGFTLAVPSSLGAPRLGGVAHAA
jgi:predicted glycoside hydrolase/deacetylase ChbG (UPF0249 family)